MNESTIIVNQLPSVIGAIILNNICVDDAPSNSANSWYSLGKSLDIKQNPSS